MATPGPASSNAHQALPTLTGGIHPCNTSKPTTNRDPLTQIASPCFCVSVAVERPPSVRSYNHFLMTYVVGLQSDRSVAATGLLPGVVRPALAVAVNPELTGAAGGIWHAELLSALQRVLLFFTQKGRWQKDLATILSNGRQTGDSLADSVRDIGWKLSYKKLRGGGRTKLISVWGCRPVACTCFLDGRHAPSCSGLVYSW